VILLVGLSICSPSDIGDNTLGSWFSICSLPSDIGDLDSWFSICSPPSDIGDNTLGSCLSICSPPSDIGLVYVLPYI
jgi:hypothetical protein